MNQPLESEPHHTPNQAQYPYSNTLNEGLDRIDRIVADVFERLRELTADNEQRKKEWEQFWEEQDREREERRRKLDEQLRMKREERLRQEEQRRRELEAQMRRLQDEERKEREEKSRKNQEDMRRSLDDMKRLLQQAMNQANHNQRQRQPKVPRAWAAYEAQRLSLPPQLEFHTILWPVLTPPSRAPSQTRGAPPIIKGLTRGALREFVLSPMHPVDISDRARVQAALLRWHPDKMGRIMERVVEKDQGAVEEGVKLVVGELAILLREVSESRKT